MKVYLATRFTNRDFARAFQAKVLSMRPKDGVKIEFIQTWTEEPVELVLDEMRQKELAYRDMRELDEADALFLLTEGCDMAPGGMHFEAGYAYAEGKHVVVIGPRVTVFYHMGFFNWYPSVQDFLASDFESAFNE